MNAKEARKLTDSLNKETVKKQLESVYAEINTNVKLGRDYCHYSAKLSELTIKKIRDDGYSVDFAPDQRDGDFYTIKW